MTSKNDAKDIFLGAYRMFSPSYLHEGEAPELETEIRFNAERRWQADFILGTNVLIEIDGGVWMEKGRHTTGRGYTDDCYKLNKAAEQGYAILRFTTNMVSDDPDFCVQQAIRTWRNACNSPIRPPQPKNAKAKAKQS